MTKYILGGVHQKIGEIKLLVARNLTEGEHCTERVKSVT